MNDDDIEETAGAADAYSVCSADVGMSADLQCPTCGLPLRNFITRGEPEETEECREDDDNEQAEPKDSEDQASKKRVKTESRTTPRRPALKPGVVHYHSIRRAVREEMIARIPGFNRARARAVVARYPDATFSSIAKTPAHVLSSVKVGKMNIQLGEELARALKRVVS